MPDFGISGDKNVRFWGFEGGNWNKNAQFWGFEGKNGSKMPDFGILEDKNTKFGVLKRKLEQKCQILGF